MCMGLGFLSILPQFPTHKKIKQCSFGKHVRHTNFQSCLKCFAKRPGNNYTPDGCPHSVHSIGFHLYPSQILGHSHERGKRGLLLVRNCQLLFRSNNRAFHVSQKNQTGLTGKRYQIISVRLGLLMNEQSKNERRFQILEEEKDFILSCCQHCVINESGSLLKQVMNLNYDISFHLFIV